MIFFIIFQWGFCIAIHETFPSTGRDSKGMFLPSVAFQTQFPWSAAVWMQDLFPPQLSPHSQIHHNGYAWYEWVYNSIQQELTIWCYDFRICKWKRVIPPLPKICDPISCLGRHTTFRRQTLQRSNNNSCGVGAGAANTAKKKLTHVFPDIDSAYVFGHCPDVSFSIAICPHIHSDIYPTYFKCNGIYSGICSRMLS